MSDLNITSSSGFRRYIIGDDDDKMTADMGELNRLADLDSVDLNSTSSSGLRRFLDSEQLDRMINNGVYDYSDVTPPEAFTSFQFPYDSIEYSDVTPPEAFISTESQMDWVDDGYDYLFVDIEIPWYDDGCNELLGEMNV